MGEIEKSIKPILVGMMSRQKLELSVKDQGLVATWITLKSIVGEMLEPETAYIPRFQVEWFYRNRKPPPGWRIFVTTISGEFARNAYHHQYYRVSQLPFNAGIPSTEYYQSSTFIAGYLFMQAISGTHDRHLRLRPPEALRGIHSPLEPIHWPISPGISRRSADTLKRSALDALAVAISRRGG